MSTSEQMIHLIVKVPVIAIEHVYMLAGLMALGCAALALGVAIWAHHQNNASSSD